MTPNRTINERLRHLYAAGPDTAALVQLIEEALADDDRERNVAAVEAIEDANVDQIFSETDSEKFDELLTDLEEQIGDGRLYKAFVQFQTDLLARAAAATNQVEVAIKILEGHHGPTT